ncbi:MAG TPA: isoleucine--tRNA ligase [Candidatus Saccharimonadales bacterium]|nr:isoleucine--tRNA ligase [Candidatus Saccharimonadales bacterium]
MQFHKGQRRKAIEYEKDLVKYWKEHDTFAKSVEQRPNKGRYVFYDGPPFITGVPHHGTLLSSIVKDAVPRYWTMKGKRVERVWGWDCHGLPAEVFTEKKLGIQDKRDIGTKVTLEEYIMTCRDNMVQTGNQWESTIERIGRWVDFQGAYKTMDKTYMESVWWAFKQLYDAGKIYEGEKVLLYCTRDATPISKAEVAMDNSYQDVTDPSVYVKFKLTDLPKQLSTKIADNNLPIYLLAWTTTPWTLPANTACAVNKDFTYALVKVGDTRLIIAEELLQKVLKDDKNNQLAYEVETHLKGSYLVGLQYEPLFENRGKNAHKVWAAEYVTMDDGTGIVHLAPAYGEEDFALAQACDFPMVQNIDDNGYYTEGLWQGLQVWDVNKRIAKELQEKGVVWKIEYIRHSYPHCHRCGTKLMYRAHPSWFMDIAGQRQLMLEENETINWFPTHIKHGRFQKTVESAPDWNLSRDRFWATAVPVWKGKDNNGNEYVKVVGSYAELKELSGVELEDYHRPWIDDVTFTLDGVTYKRIDKVLDCWFESGSMPFAQFHYPFENRDKFEQDFPGDFIAEYVGQVRAWFYYLHTVSTGLFKKNAFKNVIVTGTLAGNDGRKMSKSYGNYTDPNELMDKYSADALRFLLLSSPVLNGEDYSLVDKDVADVARKLGMVWNMYDFFTLYAEVDKWDWDGSLDNPLPTLTNPLDRWIVSRLHKVSAEVDEQMQQYDLPNALKPLLPLIDDASNWYVRRSRRRFWKSGDSKDKDDAYRTLHYVLVQLSIILAPFTPFLSEELYRLLTGGESVHLLNWPETQPTDDAVLHDMDLIRTIITEGLAQRAAAGIKVRQPLGSVIVHGDKVSEDLLDIVKDELNVKLVEVVSKAPEATERTVTLDTELTEALREEGIMREIVRHVQNARKQAGLDVADRIQLLIGSDSLEIQHAVETHASLITSETLASELGTVPQDAYTTHVTVEGMDVEIALAKA